MDANQATFCICIPTINRADLLLKALETYKVKFSGTEILVLDNGNQPELLQRASEFPNMTLLTSGEKNIGVAASWNALVQRAFEKYEYAFVLNDDVIMGVSEDDIVKFINKFDFLFAKGEKYWSSFILSKECYATIGSFDEKFFPAYFEDMDYEYRMKLAGVRVITNSILTPEVYVNSGSSEKDRSLLSNYKQNEQYYIAKWGGIPSKEKATQPFIVPENVVKPAPDYNHINIPPVTPSQNDFERERPNLNSHNAPDFFAPAQPTNSISMADLMKIEEQKRKQMPTAAQPFGEPPASANVMSMDELVKKADAERRANAGNPTPAPTAAAQPFHSSEQNQNRRNPNLPPDITELIFNPTVNPTTSQPQGIVSFNPNAAPAEGGSISMDQLLQNQLTEQVKKTKIQLEGEEGNNIHSNVPSQDKAVVSIHILLTTIGRDSLNNTLNSLVNQLTETDFITVVSDLEHNKVRTMLAAFDFKCTVQHISNNKTLGFWGHASRNRFQNFLRGDYIHNGDDDCVYAEGAIQKMKNYVTGKPVKLYIFKIKAKDGSVIWNEQKVVKGNVDTGSGLIPNMHTLPAKWAYVYNGDFDFYNQLSAGIATEFVSEVIYSHAG